MYLSDLVVHNSEMSVVEKRFAQLVVSISYFSMIPMFFVTFDAHHDGLILATVRQTRQALITGSVLPFNQYGPAWSLIDTLLTWPVSQSYLMFSLRVLTFGLYVLTGYLLFRVGIKIYNLRTAYFALTIFSISQPFVSTFKSGFMSWPSAYVAPSLLALIFLLMRRKESNKVRKNLSLDFCISSILLLLILTRVQVGILAILLVALLYLFFLGKRSAFLFFTALCITALVIVVGLLEMFDSSYVFQDEFIYGVLYASSGGGFIIPKVTLLGAFFWMTVYFYLQGITRGDIRLSKLNFLLAFSVIFIFLVLPLTLFILDVDLFAIGSIFQRRLWISLFTAGLFVSIGKFLLLSFRYLVLRQKGSFSNFLLIGFSIIGFLQVFPLFDQLHSWWGSAPLVLMISNFALNAAGQYGKSLRVFLVALLGLIVLNAYLVFGSLAIPRVSLPASDIRLINESVALNTSLLKIGNEIRQTIPEGSKVQNLCSDPNVFLIDSVFRPSSHLVVFWKNFADVPYMAPFLKATPGTYIVDCDNNLLENPNRFGYEEERSTRLSIFSDSIGRTWSIYKYS